MEPYHAEDGTSVELIKAEGTVPIHYNVRNIVLCFAELPCFLPAALLGCMDTLVFYLIKGFRVMCKPSLCSPTILTCSSHLMI